MDINVIIITIVGSGLILAILDISGLLDKTKCFIFGHRWEEIWEDENASSSTKVCNRCSLIDVDSTYN